jgi:hypothetical protein
VNWLFENYKWLFDGVAAAMAVAIAGFFLRRWGKSSPKPVVTLDNAKESSVSNSPVSGGTGNSQNVNAPVFNFNVAPSSNSTIEPIAPPARGSSAPFLPNIQYVGCRQKTVFINPGPIQGICDPRNAKEGDRAVPSLVLLFENKLAPDRKVAYASNVICKLRFTAENGVTEQHLNYGVWLNSSLHHIDIGIGDTCELVLICIVDGKLMAFGDLRSANHNFDEFAYLDSRYVDGFPHIEVTVIERGTQTEFRRVFNVQRNGLGFKVA